MTFLKNINSDKITLKDQTFIFKTMVDLMGMGISIRKSVEFIRVMKPEIALQMNNVIERLRKGYSFSTAFKPYVSTNIYYQLEIADRHGGLVRTLDSISKIFSSQCEQKRKIKALVQYPIFLMIFLGVMMIGMRLYIMPELSNWNAGTSTFQSQILKIIMLAIVGIGILVLVKQWMNFKKKSITNQVILLCRIPIFGSLYKTYCHYYLSANLSFLIGSGMSVGSICKYLVQLDSTSLLFQIGKKIEKGMMEGQGVDEIISKAVFLPDELAILIQKGSQKETLSKEINALAIIKYKTLVQKMEKLVLVIQPILFGIVGLIIVLMYLNLLMPMYNSMKEVA